MASASGQGAAGVVDVEVLDHPAVDGDHALALGLGLLEGGDDAPGLRRSRRRSARRRALHGSTWLGMDQRLAVEAELAALHALGLEAGRRP